MANETSLFQNGALNQSQVDALYSGVFGQPSGVGAPPATRMVQSVPVSGPPQSPTDLSVYKTLAQMYTANQAARQFTPTYGASAFTPEPRLTNTPSPILAFAGETAPTTAVTSAAPQRTMPNAAAAIAQAVKPTAAAPMAPSPAMGYAAPAKPSPLVASMIAPAKATPRVAPVPQQRPVAPAPAFSGLNYTAPVSIGDRNGSGPGTIPPEWLDRIKSFGGY